MFPYFGSKARKLEHYPTPVGKRIVEPFAGSASYSIFHASAVDGFLWAESRPEIRTILAWAATMSDADLDIVRAWEGFSADGIDVYDVLPKGHPLTDLIRLHCAGLYKGTFARKLYKQMRFVSADFVAAVLSMRGKGVTIYNDGFEALRATNPETDWCFIDPPYHATVSGYTDAKTASSTASAAMELATSLGMRGVFCYGNGAKELWPDKEWFVVESRRTSRAHRNGGNQTKDRTEYYCFL
jgi:site-specific DNA-adenine methylase